MTDTTYAVLVSFVQLLLVPVFFVSAWGFFRGLSR